MSILSPIDQDVTLVYSPLMSVPFRELLLDRGTKLVEVPDEEFESMGCNVLAVAPGKCIVVDGNPITRKRLEAAGAEVGGHFGCRHFSERCRRSYLHDTTNPARA